MMHYQFDYKVNALDFWQLSMYYTYSSIVGVCNIVFTVAMILMTVKFWAAVNVALKMGMLIASCLFIVIQPIVVYMRAKKQAAAIPNNMKICLDDRGIHVSTENKRSDIKWKTVKGLLRKPTMLVIFSTPQKGFILTNKVLGSQKEEIYHYVASKLQNK